MRASFAFWGFQIGYDRAEHRLRGRVSVRIGWLRFSASRLRARGRAERRIAARRAVIARNVGFVGETEVLSPYSTGVRFRMVASQDKDQLIGRSDSVRDVFDELPLTVLATEGPRHELVAINAGFRILHPNIVKVGVGKSVWETAPDATDQNVYQIFDEVYRTGEPLHASEWRVQVDFDGSGTIQERYIDNDVTARRRPDGEIFGLLMIISDVTDQVRRRMAVQAEAEQMTEQYTSLRDQTTAMQRALLATSVPVLPGLDISAEYLVASEETAAGGDWFDAIPAGSGRVFLVVGDVVGHGIAAAAAMAQLRTALRMQLGTADADITVALQAVDRFARDIVGAESTTLCVLRLDPATGAVEYCTAGHPPPLVVGARAGARYLEPSGAGPLNSGRGFATRSERLRNGEVVLLYSDGIIERPGVTPTASTVELADVVSRIAAGGGFAIGAPTRTVDRLCSQTVELLIRATGYSDDITLLAAQRCDAVAPLRVTARADRDAEHIIRDRLRVWLDRVGADTASAYVLEHAVTEFVANTVEHAYPDGHPGEVTLTAELGDDGRLRVTVADAGRWRNDTTPAENRGRGLSLAQMLLPDISIHRGERGTTVSGVYRLTRAAHIVTDAERGPKAPDPRPSTHFDVAVGDDDHAIVVGDVDTGAAPTLAGILSRHSNSGTRPLHFDLSAVTHLGSAGIGVLFDTVRRAERNHTACTLIAVPGGIAHHVLALVGLTTTHDRREPA